MIEFIAVFLGFLSALLAIKLAIVSTRPVHLLCRTSQTFPKIEVLCRISAVETSAIRVTLNRSKVTCPECKRRMEIGA